MRRGNLPYLKNKTKYNTKTKSIKVSQKSEKTELVVNIHQFNKIKFLCDMKQKNARSTKNLDVFNYSFKTVRRKCSFSFFNSQDREFLK